MVKKPPRGEDVSTLLEILAFGGYCNVLRKMPVKFQPFLRFWAGAGSFFTGGVSTLLEILAV